MQTLVRLFSMLHALALAELEARPIIEHMLLFNNQRAIHSLKLY